MNISARKFLQPALLAALFALFVQFSPASHAAGDIGSLAVVKVWEGEGELPGSVTLYLKNGGQTVGSLTLSAADALPDGSWAGSFENVPLYDGKGNAIQYSVDEKPIPGWELSVTQLPQAETLVIKAWGRKVTPASEKSYSVDGANMLAANKGGSYYVWTRAALSDTQKSRLLSEVNTAGLSGFGKALDFRNTVFQSGLPAFFEDGASLRQDGQQVFVDFEDTSVWSLFHTGSIELGEARAAKLVNRTATVPPAPTPVPSPTATPFPSPSMQPTPLPSQPPKTGDIDIVAAAAAPILFLLAAGLAARKLKRG